MGPLEQMNDQWFWAAIVGFLVGALIVWLFMRSGKNKSNEDYAAIKKEYHQYREEVNAHFAKTADAVDNLTKSYQDVFTHLSDGAEKLMDKKALQAQLDKRQGKAVTLAYLVDEKDQNKAKSTKIEKNSVVDHKATADKPVAQSTAKPVSKVATANAAVNKDKPTSVDDKTPISTVNSTKAGKDAAQKVNNTAQIAAASKAVNTDKDKTKPASVASVNKDQDVKPNVTTAQSVKPQVAPVKSESEQIKVDTKTVGANQSGVKQPANADVQATQSAEKTPAQEAALKARLAPVSPLEKKEGEESAIDSVKRHLRDNDKSSSNSK